MFCKSQIVRKNKSSNLEKNNLPVEIIKGMKHDEDGNVKDEFRRTEVF